MHILDWKKDFDENEKPLEQVAVNGGYCGIFRKIGCIGDSLSSGEFESTKQDGTKGYHDLFDYSWGQYLARLTGTTVYNFSRGGMHAVDYYEKFADENRFWNPQLACNAYIVALGVNDVTHVFHNNYPFGTIEDVEKTLHGETDERNFVVSYVKILMKLRTINKDAPLFLMTMPKDSDQDCNDKREQLNALHKDILLEISKKMDHVYLLDLREYAPIYSEEFHKKFYMGGHMNPMGYVYTANLVASYIDYIIRHNMNDFMSVGFHFTPWKNTQDNT